MIKLYLFLLIFSFSTYANENSAGDGWEKFLRHPNQNNYAAIEDKLLHCKDESNKCYINQRPNKSELVRFELLIQKGNWYAINLWMLFMSGETVVNPWDIADYENYVFDLGINALGKNPEDFLILVNKYKLSDRLPQLIGGTILKNKNSNITKIIEILNLRRKKILSISNRQLPQALIDKSAEILEENIKELRQCYVIQSCWEPA